jgi:hypothetical protein
MVLIQQVRKDDLILNNTEFIEKNDASFLTQMHLTLN